MMPEMQHDDFEAMLDRTLRSRSQSTPRAGFHQRLTEYLRQAERDRDTPRGWWNWLTASLSTAALASLVFGSFAVLHRHTLPVPQQGKVQRALRSDVPAAVAIGPTYLSKAAAQRVPVQPRIQRALLSVPLGQAATEEAKSAALPKLDTFPSPAHESDRPFGSGDPVVAVSPEAARAMLGLQQQQARPITLTALNINRPFFGESQ